jgi:D-aminopeptidase
MTGVMSIRRTGRLDAPILLTGTGNIGIVYQAALETVFPTRGIDIPPTPVVAECWDALGDIRGRHVTAAHVRDALRSARGGQVAEGGVGGGAGMTSYGFKGGIGTSSRVVEKKHGGFTTGVLVNANHGLREQLLIAGVPIGNLLRQYPVERARPASSIVMIAATDAPLSQRQLQRMALRMAMGLARTGATANTSSGDLMLAFSTAKPGDEPLDDEAVSPLYEAVVESTEEAVLNALAMGTDVLGIDGKLCPGLPVDRVIGILTRRGVIR